MPAPIKLFDSTGGPITLDPTPFAVGGEGTIHDLIGDSSVVAKLYKNTPTAEQEAKLRLIPRLVNSTLLNVAAWPTATLHPTPGGPVQGLLMPRLVGFREIFHLYSPVLRKQDFPSADWVFLIRAARNCAIAFQKIHDSGHVVGDVNQKNVLVSLEATVRLLDCDSFQVRGPNGKLYRCDVGVPEFTPPELQNRPFPSVDRTENHDRFGLAVMIFQLLMSGQHPYAGVYSGAGEMLMEQAISTGRFAYSRSPGMTQMTPPPHAPSIRLLSAKLVDLFEQAFAASGSNRPSPYEWNKALETFESQLQRCDTNSKHAYLRSAGSCPWCELVTRFGIHKFSPSLAAGIKANPHFDLAIVWAQIEAIGIPEFSYTRPPVSRPAGLVGKAVPPALGDYSPEPKPLSADLGLHAPRPVKPNLTHRQADSPEPSPPPQPPKDHAPRPQPPVISDHAPRPAPPFEGDHAPRPQPPVSIDHAPRPQPPTIADHAPGRLHRKLLTK